jgi:hypothetical protein
MMAAAEATAGVIAIGAVVTGAPFSLLVIGAAALLLAATTARWASEKDGTAEFAEAERHMEHGDQTDNKHSSRVAG